MNRKTHVAVWLRMLAEKEIKLARHSSRILKTQARQAADAYTVSGQGAAENIVNDGFKVWYSVLSTYYAITVKDFVSYTFDQLGAKKSTFQEIVQGYISAKALEKARFITGTTLGVIKSAILRGQQDGLGETQIAKAISESVGGAIGEARSRIIARTEIHNAATYGMQAAAEETQQKLTKEWVSVHDERTRDAHAEADGQTVGLDEPFEVDGEFIDIPGEGSAENSINCRCTVIYNPISPEVSGDSGGGDFVDG